MSQKAIKSVGLVAGSGALPAEIINRLEERGTRTIVAAIEGEASPTLNVVSGKIGFFNWGEIGRILKFFRANDCRELVLAGAITKRPNFMSIVGDPGTMRRLPKIIKALRGGDDGVLRRVIDLIEDEGFTILPLGEVAGDLLAPVGKFSAADLDQTNKADLIQCIAMLSTLSPYDVGQGCVVENGRVLAIEAAEGTDAMLMRVHDLRKLRRTSRTKPSGVFVKAAKRGQDLRVDLPTIGLDTIENAIKADLTAIAVEEGKVIILQRDEIIKRADESGLALFGFKSEDSDP